MSKEAGLNCLVNDWEKQYLGDMDVTWNPISLTHVIYPKGDTFAKILAYSSLFPIFVVSGFITLIIFRRELHTMVFFGGVLINEILNLTLKHTLKSPRPCQPGDCKLLMTKHGMPSNHAQFMSFFAVYMVLFAYIRMKIHVVEKFTDNLRRHGITLFSIASTVIVCISRVYLRYHTIEQVLVGVVIGLVTGSCWFYLVENFFTPMFCNIVNTKLAEYFLIRDSTNIPDILWFEYTASRTESRQRSKRISQKSQ
ncbi:dolichyldiphosphatase 1 isoform X2 [Hydra vulgaris]|uniref:Dolichyldiphosphatase n=1 Tax=Hydra vulgaris TaxID=6087 RepID=A0ABM4BFG9_HYDVU